MIIESFFGVVISSTIKFSPESIKSLPIYASAPKRIKKSVDRICDIFERVDTSSQTKMRLLQEVSCYTPLPNQCIELAIFAIGAERAKKQADQLDMDYAALIADIKSKEEDLGEIQKELDKSKDSDKDIKSIQCYIDECIEIIENIKMKMKEYDTTTQDIQIFTKDILDKKYNIIKHIEGSLIPIWSKYNIISMEMSYLDVECDSNSSDGDNKHDNTGRNYAQKMLEHISTNIGTLKRFITNDTSNKTKE